VAWHKVLEGGGTLLGDDVEITLNVEALREKEAPKNAAPAPKKN